MSFKRVAVVICLVSIVVGASAEKKDECLEKRKKAIQDFGTKFQESSNVYSDQMSRGPLKYIFDSKAFNQQISEIAQQYKALGDSVTTSDPKTLLAEADKLRKKRIGIVQQFTNFKNTGFIPNPLVLMYFEDLGRLNTMELTSNMFDSAACN